MFNRFIVICEDGSREEVIAESYRVSHHASGDRVLEFKPSSRRRNNQQGKFWNPKGVHRIEKRVKLPEGAGEVEAEDDD